MIEADPERAKAASNTFLKMPEEVIGALAVPGFSVAVDPKQVDLWIDMMVPTGLLKNQLEAKDLIK